MLRFVHHRDPSAFRGHTDALLHAREIECSKLLGVAMGPRIEQVGTTLATVDDGDAPVVAAVRLPGRALLVTEGSDEAMRLLGLGLRAIDPAVTRVVGPAAAARIVADALAPGRAGVHRRLRLHALTEVAERPPPPGALRPATHDELDLMVAWAGGFAAETGHVDDDRRAAVAAHIVRRSLFVWDDAGPRAMATAARPTSHTTSITLVYTPPDARGRGYASACVAALSQHLLATGRSACVLFTDVANPISNAIYARIGFQPRLDFEEWVCDPA